MRGLELSISTIRIVDIHNCNCRYRQFSAIVDINNWNYRYQQFELWISTIVIADSNSAANPDIRIRLGLLRR